MKLTTTTAVTVDSVMQDPAGRMRTAAADSSVASGPTRPSSPVTSRRASPT
jgi:hypothetical protein